MNEPSLVQLEIMLLIRSGPISQREIQEERGKNSHCGISKMIKILRRKGLVEESDTRHRLTRLTPAGEEACRNYYLLRDEDGIHVCQLQRSYEENPATS